MARTGGRVEALDGVRGLALLAVLGYHAAPGVVRGGFLGVELFFVLSGYLLASVLLGERARTGSIDMAAYATRRIRRIVPALGLVLGVLAIGVPLVAPDAVHRLPGDIASSAAGLTNWHLIADGSSYFAMAGRPSFVRHLWSIAIEVQFYAICPFLVAWLARRRRTVAARLVGAGIIASAAAMAVRYAFPDPSRAYFGTETRIGALLTGVLLAVLVSRRPSGARPTAAAGAMALILFAALVFLVHERGRALYPFGFLAVQASGAVLILVGIGGRWPSGLLGRRWLRWLGERSYGIYLWHWPAVVLLRPRIDAGWLTIAAGVGGIGVALALGAASYRFVERPIIHGEPVFGPDGRRTRLAAAALAAAAAASIVGHGDAPDPIAESLVAGERALASQPSVARDAPGTEPSGRPDAPAIGPVSVAAAAAPEPPPPPPPPPIPVVAVGDSVMLGAAPALTARLGVSGLVDAVKSRQFDEGIDLVRRLRAEGRLDRVAIVQLGNNGPVRPEQVDAMLHELVDVRHVLLVTVRVHKPWQDGVNAAVRDAPGRHPKVIVVDWFAHSEGRREWFAPDGTHLNGAGADAYADRLAGAVPPPSTPAPPPTPPPPTPTPQPEGPVPLPRPEP